MASYRVVETFVSVNGEGRKAGQLSVFIRLQGCNLKCSYCDTLWANQKDTPFQIYTEEELYSYIIKTGIRNITITGGEPLLNLEIQKLFEILSENPALRVEVETNGSVSLKEFIRNKNTPSFTLDYKLPGSGMEDKMLTSNFQFLRKKDSVKFVVAGYGDLIRAKEIIELFKLDSKCKVYFSPVFGKIEPEVIVNFLLENKMNDVTMQLQLHKIIWDPEKRGV